MSYILDALRKSEQERSRGKLPELNRFGDPDHRVSGQHRWAWIIGGALVLTNVIGVGIWLSRPDSPAPSADIAAAGTTNPAVAKTDTPETSASGSAPAPSATAATGSVPVSTASCATQPQAAGAAAQMPAATAQPVAAAPQPGANAPTPVAAGQTVTVATPAVSPPPGTVYYVTQGTPVPGQQIVVLPAGSAVAPTVAPTTGALPAGVVQMPSQPVAAWPNQGTVEPPPPVPPPPPPVNLDQALDAAGASAPTPNVGYLPQMDELPDYVRAQIPDMTFSSHMYSSMPRFRSVVINGSRVKEGQMVGDTIQVTEITETGVVLSVGGTLFQVDVLGKWAQ